MATKEIPFYNVDFAVGPNAINKRTDVMLVQFFLREIYNHPSLIATKPPGTMVVDGLCGPITSQWILHFQQDVKKHGKSVLIDGRVDHARGEQCTLSSISRTGYTIGHLNATYRKRYLAQHDYLERHPKIPGELAQDLAKGNIA